MKKNNYWVVIILVLIVTLSLSYLYRLEYGDKGTSTYIVNNSLVSEGNEIDTGNEEEEEIALGDTNHCKSYNYTCPNGGSPTNGTCYKQNEVKTGVGPDQCSGSWSMGKCYTFTTYKATKTSCKECDDYYYLSNGVCKQCNISVRPDENTVSPGTEWHIKVLGYSDPSCPRYTGSLAKTAGNNACGKSVATIKYGSITKTVTIRIAGKWEKADDGYYDNFMAINREQADGKDYDFSVLGMTIFSVENTNVSMEYGTCWPAEGGKVYCKNVYQRGTCGAKRTAKTYSYCCVNNQYIGVSDSVKWTGNEYGGAGVLVNYNEKKNGKLGCAYYYGDSYTYVAATKDKCKVTDAVPGRCTAATVNAKKVDDETTKCEEAKTIKIYDGEKCTGDDLGVAGTDINTSFYTISCTREVSTNFDYGDDEKTDTSRELYAGQGFKFGIDVTSKIKCDGEFFGTRWKETYNKLWNKIQNVESGLVNACKDFSEEGLTKCENYINKMKFNRTTTKKDVFELLTIIRELVGIVDTYNNYMPNIEADTEEATINFKYTNGGKKETKVVSDIFNKTIVDKGVYKSTNEKVVDLGVSGITNPKNYSRSNYTTPRIVKFTFKNVYIDKTDGLVKENPKEKIDGGQKIYIDYSADVQTIEPISIVVNGLAGNNSSMADNKCTISIKDLEIIYRPIDVSNPFINNKWTPGSNWINSQFDFRNIIHSDIWSGSNCYSRYANGTWVKCN